MARPPADAPTLIHADSVRSTADEVSLFRGAVDLKRGAQHLTSEELRYDGHTGHADATGNVVFSDTSGVRFEVPELHYNLQTHVGEAAAGTYRLPDGQGRGDMQRTEFEGPDHTRVTSARYTTCPAGRDDWFIRAREIDFDTAADVGVARHARVDFFGIPIFYLPYFTFPISDERKSGFLVPQVGYGGRLGATLATPYYWNMAPNYDMTFTPRLLGQRGLQLQDEFRYLGQNFDGRLQAELLPDDHRTGENRAAGTLLHSHVFNPYWTASVDLRGVSDKDYLSDFGDHLNVTAQTHLPQNAEINYRGSVWTFTARAADYQTVDQTIAPAAHPYARLPQLLLAARPPGEPNGARYRFDGELVNFEHSVNVAGQRAHLNPAVSLPLGRPYGFITPEIGAHYLGYRLENAPLRNPSITVPYAALDSGLFFERELRLGARDYVQTLEPRLFYLYLPFREQDALPNFDTTLPDFTFANLFRTNRFVGGDRVGDANQLTAALTTRFLDDSDGTERLRASIGQIHYFADRRVNLPPTTAADDRSNLAAEAAAWLIGNWYANATVEWNGARHETQRSSYYLQYNPERQRIVNVGQRFVRDQQIDQLDISTEWPVTPQWTVRARSLYSQREHRNVENYAGVQYNACCWALRVHLAQRLVQTGPDIAATEQTREIMLELELSGLAKLGAAPDSPLKQSLFGFAPADARR